VGAPDSGRAPSALDKRGIMKKSIIIVLVLGVTAVLIAAVAALFVLRVFFVDLHFIPQNGMYPTLPRGTYVISARRPYTTVDEVSRGHIVVYVRIQDGHRYLYIWRVIGLPGDRISTSADSLTLNDHPVRREIVREEDGFVIFREFADDGDSYQVAIANAPENVPPDVAVEVAEEQLFVMGDNRYNAYDSRFSGSIPFSSIVGKVIWP
jgi:signal peptidase I